MAAQASVLNPQARSELQSVLDFEARTSRLAYADIYLPPGVPSLAEARDLNAVVFGHGFSQDPENYITIRDQLLGAGWVVVAPTTGVLDVLGRQVGYEASARASSARSKLPVKLQAALIIDLLRTAQLLHGGPGADEACSRMMAKGQARAHERPPAPMLFLGHSLGGACSILAAAKLQSDKIRGVVLLSAQVSMMQQSPVNDDIWLLDGNKRSTEAALKFFQDEFPRDTPLIIVSPDRDVLAPRPTLECLFTVAAQARKDEQLALFEIKGDHTGYEDRLDLPTDFTFQGARVPLPALLQAAVKGALSAINLLAIPLAEKVLLGEAARKQKEVTAQVLQQIIDPIFNYKDINDSLVVQTSQDPDLQYQTKFTVKQEEYDHLKEAIARNVERNPPLELLLGGYAVAQAAASTLAARLLVQSTELTTYLGLTFALAYENALLVAGRYIAGPLNDPSRAAAPPSGPAQAEAARQAAEARARMDALRDLSEWRFLAHSGAPLAIVAGLNLAGRAGVGWAADPVCEGLVGLSVLGVVGISSVRNTAFLTIAPRWARGILRFAYDRGTLDFTKVVPVLLTNLALIVLGVQAAGQDAAAWPFAVGPVLSLLLNAWPSAKDGEVIDPHNKRLPQFVTGNAGELVLFASMVATEYLLRGR
ncbi:hypothetical protein MNEG_1576 [Monoraphidium neglectum]|uniref:Uncharacterized protein n=1 Tax=Monoraphidium neglectum TaxID=145388 RepID=A0A0D2NPM3_9CHLO|nr:hypothetical protein MNEG_1576 [Monoraphidium neglectum]KIZ06376.1 hypothetical protein MNEG_1576 [Monoraphidium neglectum]|eukprot:XP_013905395.1 hypothetical protein MNEG_1576 [Monoraphidium neglectum]